MRRLVLLRHGKSDWGTGAPSDHQRPLKKRGRRSARKLGEVLLASGLVPEVVLCSDAVRAQESLEYLRAGLADAAGTVDVHIVPELYLGGLVEIAAACRELEPSVESVWVIGHNPGLEEAASALGGRQVTLKTADAAFLNLGAVPWSGLLEARGRLELERVLRSRALLEAADASPS